MIACSFMWCMLIVMILPMVTGTVGGKKPGSLSSSSLEYRIKTLEGLTSDLGSALTDLRSRNRDLELQLAERPAAKPESDTEQLERLVDQLERGLTFLFPKYTEETRRVPGDQATVGERMDAIRDYLGNREAQIAAVRPDRASELRSDQDTPVSVQTLGLALLELNSRYKEQMKRLEVLEGRAKKVDDSSEERRDDNEMKDERLEMKNMVMDETDRMVQYIEELERTKTAETRKSAFSVASTKPQFGHDDRPQHVEFDYALTNKGSDFNLTESTFICRIPGFYFFTYTLRTYEELYLGVILMKNDTIQVAMNTDMSARSVSSTQSAILRLSEGDRVWLRLPPSENYAIYSNEQHLSTFSGFLVFNTTS